MQSKLSFSQVVQIPQSSTQSKPPARKETESHTFFKQTQGQGKRAPFQGCEAFNFGKQPQEPVKQTTANMFQKQSGLNEPQNSNRFSKNEVATPVPAGEMSTIFMSTMPKLSHAEEAITRLEKLLLTKLLRKHDGRGIIINLSNKVFSKTVFELLNKNLNFCPMPGEFNRLNLNTDLQHFFRRIKLRAHFETPDPNCAPSESELFPIVIRAGH